MKMLSIRQPWASLICAGIKDVENRSWNARHRGRMLIHASSYKCPKDVAYMLPLEMSNMLLNEEAFGNIDIETWPTSAIIGYVDLTDCVEGDYDSIWADPGSVKLVLENAYMFDEPITGVKGKLNIFEYDIDESALPPAHKVERRSPHFKGGELVVPLNNELWQGAANIEKPSTLSLYNTDEITGLFYETDKKTGKETCKKTDCIKSVRFVAEDGREQTFKLLSVTPGILEDEEGDPIKVPNLGGEECELRITNIKFE